MSRKIDVKLPHEMGDYGDWRERFDKVLLHRKITPESEDKGLSRQAQIEKVAEMYNKGVPYKEMAKVLGLAGPGSISPYVNEARGQGLIAKMRDSVASTPKEDKQVAVIKKEQIVPKFMTKRMNVSKPELNDSAFDDELKDELRVFETIERETKLILKAVEDYRCLAQVSYQTLGLDKGKPIVEAIYQQLRQEVSQILEVGA